MRKLPRNGVVAAVALAILAGGALAVLLTRPSGDAQPAAPTSSERPPSGARKASFLARMIPTRNGRRAVDGTLRVSAETLATVRSLPVEQKVAQLLAFGFVGQDMTAEIFDQLARLGLGAVVLEQANYSGPDQIAALAGETAVAADAANHLRPIVIASQPGGADNALPGFQPLTAPADLSSVAAGAQEAREAAQTLPPLGVSGVLAPDLDVAGPDAAVGSLAFSDDPRAVSRYARATVTAYRTGRLMAFARRFPGLGSGSEDTRYGLSRVGLELDELRRRDLAPFRVAVEAGVPGVQVGHGLYETDDFVTPASLSRTIVTDLLRGELGFRGIAMTDDLADPGVTAIEQIPLAAVRAVRAGADLVYISGPAFEQEAAYAAVLQAVRRGRISRARLDAAAARMIDLKRAYGVIE